ncbi:MAG: methionine--tRNA ligase [Rikenellaceae bacterium]
MKTPKRYLVTSALPYANGPVHIGHLAGVYLPSDIYTRFLRLRGEDVLSICGSDEHGVPITIKAKKEGITPQQVVDRYHGIIKEAFKGLGISFDIYSRTSSQTHHETAADFFKTLHDKGEFIEQTSEQYFDPEAQQFLADRYITGGCPKCGAEGAYGDQCEKCGSTLSPTELIDPRSAISGAKPIMKQTTHWYLPLDKHQSFLEDWILRQHGAQGSGEHWKSNVYGQCKSWLDAGLQPRAVSRDLDWGIPVPVEGGEGKVLYVWFDAPIGYISATKDLTPDWETYWKDEETKMVHFIGKDNIVFHCIVFPAMLRAHGGYNLPENVPANEFLNLENDKISTSKNWAVWLHEYLEEFPSQQDVLRYVLCANAPETKDNDFTWRDFQARNNSELVAIFGNFVNRALVLTSKYFENRVPSCGELSDFDREIIEGVASSKALIEKCIMGYKFREALKEMMNLARLGNKYLADTEPWKVAKTDLERTGTILNVALQICANLSIACEPFLPFTSDKLLGMLASEKFGWDRLGAMDLLLDGHSLAKATLLFEKIEDSQIEAQLAKLEATKTANEAANVTVEPQKELCSFDDFMKMDLRVGRIIEAEKVAKTKKLLKLLVDTGIDKRTIVSGIAEHFTPEELIGKQVTVLANLAPRAIKGIESQGMLLFAEDPASGKLHLMNPAVETPEGSQIG